jgi:hypothetical protein
MDRELLAAIGQVVVDAAALEYFVAVLLAVADGQREHDCEDHAVATVKIPGEAMRELRKRACAQLRGQGLTLRQIAGMLPDPCTTREDREKTARKDLADWDREHPGVVPLTRCDLGHLWRDAKAVLDDRHVIAHSIALEADEAGDQPGLVMLHPRSGKETRLTTAELLSHVQDIRIVSRRFHKAIAEETSDDP